MECLAGRGYECPDVILGAAAVSVDDMQHPGKRFDETAVSRSGQNAKRAERIGVDVIANEIEIARMTRDQQRHIALRQLAPRAAERAAPRVHDKCVVAEDVAEARGRRAHAEVVLLAVAQSEDRIERSDGINQGAADVQAEADASRNVGIRRRSDFAKRACHERRIAIRGPRIVFAEPRQRADLGVIRKRRDRADPPVRRRTAGKRVEPALRDDRIRIEQHHIGVRTRVRHATIRRQREAEILRVREEFETGEDSRSQLVEVARDCIVGRRVVDEHKPVVARACAPERYRRSVEHRRTAL